MHATTTDEDLGPQTFRAAVMNELIKNEIATVTISFDGSGDEGQVDEITCTKPDGSNGSLDFPANVPGKTICAGAKSWDSSSRQYVSQVTDGSMTMEAVLEEWTYKLLGETGVNWVDNEGGYGEIAIIPATDSIKCEMNERITDVETSHHEL